MSLRAPDVWRGERQFCSLSRRAHRWVVDNAWLTGPASDVVPAIRRVFTELPDPRAFTIWFSMAPLRELGWAL